MANDIYVSFGAETGALEAAFATAKAEAKATSAEMTKLANEMQKAGASADSDMGRHLVELGASLREAHDRMAEATEGMRAHKEEAGRTGEVLATLREDFMRLAELAGIPFTADAFKEWLNSTTEAAEKVERMAAQLGASTGEVQLLGAFAKLTGTDVEAMATQLERLQLALAKSTSALSPARAGLKALGIDAEEFRRLSIPQQFDELAEAVSRFADGATKTAAVQALGRGFVELLPLLDKGREGMDELNKAAKETGVIMSEQDVKALAEVREASNELGLAVQALGQDILLGMIGPIKTAIGWLTKFTEGMDAAVRAARSFGGFGNFIGMTEAGQAVGGDMTLPDLMSGVPDGWRGRNVTVHGRPQVPGMQLGRAVGGGGGGGSL